jgi:hypothetical protein
MNPHIGLRRGATIVRVFSGLLRKKKRVERGVLVKLRAEVPLSSFVPEP